MRLDAPTLANAWLAVAQASASRDDLAAFTRTVAIEEFPQGLRLVATDRVVLLTAWVPSLEVRHPRTPTLDELPDRTVIARDDDGRAKGLLGYVLKLARRDKLDELPAGQLEVRVDFDVRVPAGAATDQPLEGLEPTYVTLTVPDVERVYLDVVEATYPAWRSLLLDHHPQDTKAIALGPDIVSRVAGAARWADGPLVWTFGGAERVARVNYPDSDPNVEGLVMPRRWVLEGEEPAAEDTDPIPGVDEVTADDVVNVVRDAVAGFGSSLRTGESFTLSPGLTVEVSGDGPIARAVTGQNRDLLGRAIRLVAETQFGSARMLSQRLSIGQDRARGLLADLEANGIVGPAQHGSARDVLVRAEDADDAVRQVLGDQHDDGEA